ncbi:hypothetical protein U3516DRAFT_665218 [Neocallimastix sp. 'constans']
MVFTILHTEINSEEKYTKQIYKELSNNKNENEREKNQMNNSKSSKENDMNNIILHDSHEDVVTRSFFESKKRERYNLRLSTSSSSSSSYFRNDNKNNLNKQSKLKNSSKKDKTIETDIVKNISTASKLKRLMNFPNEMILSRNLI